MWQSIGGGGRKELLCKTHSSETKRKRRLNSGRDGGRKELRRWKEEEELLCKTGCKESIGGGGRKMKCCVKHGCRLWDFSFRSTHSPWLFPRSASSRAADSLSHHAYKNSIILYIILYFFFYYKCTSMVFKEQIRVCQSFRKTLLKRQL